MELVLCGSVVRVNTQGVCSVCIIHECLSYCQVVCFNVRTTMTVLRPLSSWLRHTVVLLPPTLTQRKRIWISKWWEIPRGTGQHQHQQVLMWAPGLWVRICLFCFLCVGCEKWRSHSFAVFSCLPYLGQFFVFVVSLLYKILGACAVLFLHIFLLSKSAKLITRIVFKWHCVVGCKTVSVLIVLHAILLQNVPYVFVRSKQGIIAVIFILCEYYIKPVPYSILSVIKSTCVDQILIFTGHVTFLGTGQHVYKCASVCD